MLCRTSTMCLRVRSRLEMQRGASASRGITAHPASPSAGSLPAHASLRSGIVNEALKNFLEMNLPKVKAGKKAKFQLGVVRAAGFCREHV